MAKAATIMLAMLSALWGCVAVWLAVREFRAPYPEEEVWIPVVPISTCVITGFYLSWKALRRPEPGVRNLGRFALALAITAGLIVFTAPLDQSPPWDRDALVKWALMVANIATLAAASFLLLSSGRGRLRRAAP